PRRGRPLPGAVPRPGGRRKRAGGIYSSGKVARKARDFTGARTMYRSVIFSLAVVLTPGTLASGQTREQKVRADRQKVEAEGFWIYNDLPRGLAEARRTGKPLLVVLRCIPCTECVKLD